MILLEMLALICILWILYCLVYWEFIPAIFHANLEEIISMRKNTYCAKMGFDKWLDIYYLNPKRWNLSDLPYCEHERDTKAVRSIYDSGSYIFIDFGFIGNLRYSMWAHKYKKDREKQKTKERETENLVFVLEAAQKDIETIQKKVEEETNKAKKEFEKIRDSYINNNIELKQES